MKTTYLSLKLSSWLFFFFFKVHNVPVVSELGLLALPELQEEGGPQRHHDGEADSGAVVEEEGDLGGCARRVQRPIVTTFITQRAHDVRSIKGHV